MTLDSYQTNSKTVRNNTPIKNGIVNYETNIEIRNVFVKHSETCFTATQPVDKK